MSTVPVPEAAPSSTLGVLGFTAAQEDLYRLALRHSGSTLFELAGLAGLPIDELHEQVTRFVGAGVLEVRDGRVLTRPPAEAISRLVHEEARRLQSREEQLAAVRGLLPALSADYHASSAPKGTEVEVELVAGDDVPQLIRSLSAVSTGDLLWLRPDQWELPSSGEVDRWVRDLLRSGRRSRAIYPARVLEDAPQVIRARAEAGEHVRILAEVPCRLGVLGGAAAMVGEDRGAIMDQLVVVRQSSLVASLTVLFETLWEKAMAVPGLEPQRGEDGVGDQRLLLDQLAGGAKDEQIARALGLSVRTVRRRVAELLDELGADSRFQAGVEAVRRGWM